VLEAIVSVQCSNTEIGAGVAADKCERARRNRAGMPAYLSTHRDIASRIARTRAAAR